MKLIGLVADGVALALNNILFGIMEVGYPEVLLRKPPKDSDLVKSIQASHDSERRAITTVADLFPVSRSAASTKERHDFNHLPKKHCSPSEFNHLSALYPEVQYKSHMTSAYYRYLASESPQVVTWQYRQCLSINEGFRFLHTKTPHHSFHHRI